MSALGNLIKNGRESVELTQVELAVKLGMTQQTVSRWEAGKVMPPLEHLPALARAIDVNLDELLAAAASSAVERTNTNVEPEPLRIEIVETRLDRIEALLEQIATRQERPLRAVKPVPGQGRRKRQG